MVFNSFAVVKKGTQSQKVIKDLSLHMHMYCGMGSIEIPALLIDGIFLIIFK